MFCLAVATASDGRAVTEPPPACANARPAARAVCAGYAKTASSPTACIKTKIIFLTIFMRKMKANEVLLKHTLYSCTEFDRVPLNVRSESLCRSW